jgi:hypothetical protein
MEFRMIRRDCLLDILSRRCLRATVASNKVKTAGSGGVRQSPDLPVIIVFGLRKADIDWIRACSQPTDQIHQILLGHRGASGRRTVRSSPNVKKDCAPIARHWRVCIVPDFDKPPIGKVSAPHFLFFKPGREIIHVHAHVLIVMRIVNVIHPGITISDRVERVVCPWRQRAIIGVNHSNPENAGWSTMILFHLHGRPLPIDQTSPPG